MSALSQTGSPAPGGSPSFDADVVELAFFLSHQQANALERALSFDGTQPAPVAIPGDLD